MTIITDEEKLRRTADECVHRAHEQYDYQTNADRYTVMLASAPSGDLPAHLEQYRTIDLTKLPLDISLADARLLAQHQRKDRLKISIITEQCAADHVGEILAAVEAGLPTVEADKDAAITAAVARRDAALAKA